MVSSGSMASSMRSLPTIASQSLNGSALGEGMDWMMRKSCSVSATSVRRIFPSGAGIFKPLQIVTVSFPSSFRAVGWNGTKWNSSFELKGPDWPFWQLTHPNDKTQNMLGEAIAAFGPMAHKKLANADEWDFLPRDDIQAESD